MYDFNYHRPGSVGDAAERTARDLEYQGTGNTVVLKIARPV